jgi:hypothetical protein
MLPNLVVEWSTKFEGYDRYLSVQESLLIAGVDGQTFLRVVDLLQLATVQVNAFLSSTSLELWDLKWEFAITDDEIVIVDTIDHDSMRLALRITHDEIGPCIVHFNKQAVRDYYKIFHAGWYSSLDEIKRQSDRAGSPPFKELLWNGVKQGIYPHPPELDEEFADLQSRKYSVVTAGPIADPSLAPVLAKEEVDYYEKRGRLDVFKRFNSVPGLS